ncbi:MAG: NAD(P)H-binding protein, partial [Candidatus Rokuibacteriota bacterium]
GVDSGDPDPINKWHRAGEEAFDSAGIARPFLRCGEFMTNALMWAETIKVMSTAFVPFAENPSAPIDPLDVARVAARCLTDRTAGDTEALALTGPEALTGADRVRRLGELLGKELNIVNVRRDRAYERMTGAGVPPVLADALLDMMEFKGSGRGAVPLDTVETVTGRAPATFDDWATRNLAAFR